MQAHLFLVAGALLALLSACAGIPGPPEARLRALSLIDADDPRGAIEYIDELGSEDLGLEILRAQANLATGALEPARTSYRKVAEATRDRELADFALRNLAALQLQDGQAEAAYATLSQLSAESAKKPGVQHDLGVAAVAAGRLDLARQHFAALPEDERQQVEQVLGQDFLATRR